MISPGNAIGNITFLIVCHCVAPNPNEASLNSCWTDNIESNDTEIIVGKIIIANIIPAVNIENPVPPKIDLTVGTKIVSPKNPYTTDGIPDNVCITGFKKFFILSFATSAIKIAHNIPSGADNINEKSVILSEPIIIGKTPYIPLSGNQLNPNKNWIKLYSLNNGKLSFKIKNNIVNINIMDNNVKNYIKI